MIGARGGNCFLMNHWGSAGLHVRSPPITDAMASRLGQYPLLGVIGRGSMGVVYKSIEPGTKRDIALKTLHPRLANDECRDEFEARLRVEAQAAKGLDHAGIAAVYAYGEERGNGYIAMEYVDGRSLKQYFGQTVAFSIPQVVSIVSQLLDALEHAHERGVWHRDIKPANVLVTDRGAVKLTDFGIARIAACEPTAMDDIMGTPGFIAPEMYTGDNFDSRVDLFATGAILYQLLTGMPAYAGTADQIMFKVCCEAPVAPSVVVRRPRLQSFDSVVLTALAKRPESRFATAAEFRTALLQA